MIDTSILISIFVSYLAGSIPFGLLVSKAGGLGDIRTQGSGNIGATNVLRVGNKKLALLTLALDFAKGALPVWLFSAQGEMTAHAAMLAAVLGHMFPVWLKFKGGKGVATTLGVLLGLHYPLLLVTGGVWLAVFAATRISSLSALTCFAIAPVAMYFMLGAQPALICALLSALVWWRHKENIRRLLKGEEPKFGKK